MTSFGISLKRWALGIAATLTLALLPATVLAQDEGDQRQDPPSRVARLNYSTGSVSFQPGGEGDWVDAVPNRPLTTGDNLWADKDSRAELHVGSTALRLGAETSLTFLELDDNTTQLKVSQGTLILRVRHLEDGNVMEVDTPNLAFNIRRSGEYRIDVNADGDETDTTVWHGSGEVTGGGESYTVDEGELARFVGTDQLNHEIDEIGSDDFDQWAFSRDGREDRSQSARYISPELTGAEDLDDNGSWHNVPDYGAVWTPRVEAGWAPYRQGHWAYVGPWGWTWVDDEPWGFAPFHYGRWAYVQESWCWVPGPIAVRPVYAPALVAFVGGGGFSLSIGVGGGGGGGIAWFPLGPREVYVPSYHVSRAYVNNVNVSNTTVNVTQVTNVYNTSINRTTVNNTTVNNTTIVYANQHVTNAVTVVNKETFVNARPVAANVVHVDQKQLQQAPVTHTTEFQPVKQSFAGAGKQASVHPSAAVMTRQVVAIHTPAAPAFQQRPSGPGGQANAAPQIARPNIRTVKAAAAPQPVTANVRPVNRPNLPGRPNQTARPVAAQPAVRPNQPAANEPARPNNQPAARPNNPLQPNNEAARPNSTPAARPNENNRPSETARPSNAPRPNNPPPRPQPPVTNERPQPQPREAPAPNPANNRPEAQPNRQPEPARPDNSRNQSSRPPQNNNTEANRPAPPARPAVKPTPPPPAQERPPQRNENTPQPNRPAPTPRPEAPKPEAARPEQPQPQAQRPVPRPPNHPNEKPKDEKPPKDKDKEPK